MADKDERDIEDVKESDTTKTVEKKNLTKEDKKALKEEQKREKELAKRNKKRGAGRFVPILIVLIMIGGAVAILGFDAFGLRTQYFSGILQEIPIVKNLVTAEANIEEAGPTVDELLLQIEELNATIAKDQEDIKALNDKSDMYVKEIDRLKEFEDKQAEFKQERETFDKMVAMNDPNAFTKYYEKIDPENAEKLYKEAVTANQYVSQVKNYVATFQSMDEGDAAKVLEQMITTDMNLVVLVMNNMDAEARGTILGKMDPVNAASVAKMIAPQPSLQ